MKKLCVMLCLAFCTICVAYAQGSAWTSGAARGYFKLEQRGISAQHFYDDLGNIQDIINTSIYTTSLYAQFGLLSDLDVVAYVPFVRTTQENSQLTNGIKERISQSAVGDIQLGVKYGILRYSAAALSVGLKFGVPTGVSNLGTDARLQTGDGEFNQSLHVDIGISRDIGYLTGGVSYNNRTRGFSDEVGYYLRGAITFLKRLSANAGFNRVYPLSATGNDVLNPSERYSNFLNNTGYLAYGGELVLALPLNLALSVGADRAVSGRNVLADPTWYVAVAFTL